MRHSARYTVSPRSRAIRRSARVCPALLPLPPPQCFERSRLRNQPLARRTLAVASASGRTRLAVASASRNGPPPSFLGPDGGDRKRLVQRRAARRELPPAPPEGDGLSSRAETRRFILYTLWRRRGTCEVGPGERAKRRKRRLSRRRQRARNPTSERAQYHENFCYEYVPAYHG